MDMQKNGERLRRLREEKNLSTYDVAKAVDISPQAITMYETGKRNPRDDVKLRLAKFYKKSVASIFFAD